MAEQLTRGNLDHEMFMTLRVLEDGPQPPEEKARLAGQALVTMPSLAPLYLFYGKNLRELAHPMEAEAAFRKGLLCVQESDVQTRLLLQLGITMTSEPEKIQILQQAQTVNGNLIAAAMAAFVLKGIAPMAG